MIRQMVPVPYIIVKKSKETGNIWKLLIKYRCFYQPVDYRKMEMEITVLKFHAVKIAKIGDGLCRISK